MMNSIRFNLTEALENINEGKEVAFVVAAIRKPDGTKELITNSHGLKEKIEYYLSVYDDDMFMRNNQDIRMENVMVVYK